MISHQMSLDYTLSPGWQAPFVQGLFAGQAKARKCGACAAISFPPVRICDCGGTDAAWHSLTGTAKILFRTTGTDGDFALVQFDGADTQSVVRLQDVPNECQHGQLMPAPENTPQMILTTPTDGQMT